MTSEARVKPYSPLPTATMPCVPARVRLMIVLPRKSTPGISNPELAKSKPLGARP